MAKTKTPAPVTKNQRASVPAVVKKAAPPAKASDLADLMEQDSGAGMEGTDRDAFAIPFLRVLQALSPQCVRGKAEYRAEARPGMLFNTVTQELYDGDEGIIFLPSAFQRRFIQWGARGTDGAGFKGEYLPEQISEMKANGSIVEDEGQLYFHEADDKSDTFQDTRSHFGIIIAPDGSATQALLSLSASQIKKSKQLMGLLSAARIAGNTPPTWMNRIRITTVPESNDRGSWFGVRFEAAGFLGDENDEGNDRDLYVKAKEFHDLVVGGKARVNYSELNQNAESSDEDDGAVGGQF